MEFIGKKHWLMWRIYELWWAKVVVESMNSTFRKGMNFNLGWSIITTLITRHMEFGWGPLPKHKRKIKDAKEPSLGRRTMCLKNVSRWKLSHNERQVSRVQVWMDVLARPYLNVIIQLQDDCWTHKTMAY